MVSEAPHKQKIIIAIIVVVVLIVVWQVIGLFRGGAASTEIAPTTPVPASATATPASGAPTAGPKIAPVAPVAPSSPISQVTLQKDLEFLKIQKDVQQKYLNSINELQLLRIQKEIAEANQAIITSKLATVTAEKDISDLLIPSAPAAPGTGTTGSTALAPDQASPQQTEEAALKAKIAPKTEGQYTVISVTMQFDKWNAILGYSGKLYRVNIGDTLPDGSKVLKIMNDGVLLEKSDTQTKIAIVPAL
jgi:hypothetical protein